METYLAHSAKNGYSPQSYAKHVENTKKWSLIFAKEMKGYCRKDAEQIENILYLAAPYHDLGKLDKENQKVLHKEGVKSEHLPVNHMDAGAAFLKQKGQEALCSLALVYAHHRGLPDFTVEMNRAETVCYRIGKGVELLLDFGVRLTGPFLADSGVSWNREKAGPGDGSQKPAQRIARV
uniref:HD domain-containing protein n=1 Tax=Enterocloster clostridioformis TaxID=1531 RepID=UPI0025A4F39F|nr:HD domain-containing protein [Enterocloster clostridioformis]